MTDGKKVEFSISPDSKVYFPTEQAFFVKGTILNGAANSGVITIDNPSLRKRITLDMHYLTRKSGSEPYLLSSALPEMGL